MAEASVIEFFLGDVSLRFEFQFSLALSFGVFHESAKEIVLTSSGRTLLECSALSRRSPLTGVPE